MSTTKGQPQVLVVAMAYAWRWPLVGAVAFLGCVVLVLVQIAPEFGYGVFALPHLIVGALFAMDWLAGRRVTVGGRGVAATRTVGLWGSHLFGGCSQVSRQEEALLSNVACGVAHFIGRQTDPLGLFDAGYAMHA
jgi:hypothetical protein